MSARIWLSSVALSTFAIFAVVKRWSKRGSYRKRMQRQI